MLLTKSRIISAVVATLALATLAIAGLPQTINYQGYLKDGNGVPVKVPVDLSFSLYSTVNGAGAVWTESKTLTPVNGVYSTQLGNGTKFSTANIVFDRQYWLGISVNGEPNLSPLQPLTSVPYALRAAVADSATTATNAVTLGGQTLAQMDNRYAPAVFTNASSAARIAGLRWNQPIQSGTTFSSGTLSSFGIAFDGTNIWSPNDDGTLRKFRASDGELLGIYSVGSDTYGVVSDGIHIWAAGWNVGKVRMFNAADGAIIKDITVGGGTGKANNLAFDGNQIWVTSPLTNSVTILNASNGNVVTTITNVPGASGLAFDGTSMWVTASNDNAVYKFNKNGTPGTPVSVVLPIINAQPQGLAFDGTNIWVAHDSVAAVSRFAVAGGTVDSFSLPTNGNNGIAYDGASIWVASKNGIVSRLRSDGARIGTYNVPKAFALTFDGNYIWVSADTSIVRIPAGNTPTMVVGQAGIANYAVTSAKIADGAVTSAKILTPLTLTATLASQTPLIAKGAASQTANLQEWQNSSDEVVASLAASGSLTIANSAATTSLGIQSTNTGTTADIVSVSSSGSGDVINGYSKGTTGRAGYFEISNVANTSDSIVAKTSGTGRAGYFSISNTANTSDALYVTTAGTGRAAYLNGNVAVTGKLGIGTTAPLRPLHIAGGSSAEMNLGSTEGLVNWKTWNFLVDGASGQARNLTFRILNDAGDATSKEVLVLKSDGTALLNGALLNSSDSRLKKDIQPLAGTLDKVLRLRGVSYLMKDDPTQTRKIGVIAQELETEYPELVATDDKGMKSVAYANLTPVLIEAVKALQAENKALKDDNDALKVRLERLEKALLGQSMEKQQ